MIGEERDDFRTSYLASIITNLAISINGKKGSRMKEIKDFLFDWDRTKPKKEGTQSVEDMKRIFMDIAAMNKASEERKSKRVKRIPKSLQK